MFEPTQQTQAKKCVVKNQVKNWLIGENCTDFVVARVIEIVVKWRGVLCLVHAGGKQKTAFMKYNLPRKIKLQNLQSPYSKMENWIQGKLQTLLTIFHLLVFFNDSFQASE